MWSFPFVNLRTLNTQYTMAGGATDPKEWHRCSALSVTLTSQRGYAAAALAVHSWHCHYPVASARATVRGGSLHHLFSLSSHASIFVVVVVAVFGNPITSIWVQQPLGRNTGAWLLVFHQHLEALQRPQAVMVVVGLVLPSALWHQKEGVGHQLRTLWCHP